MATVNKLISLLYWESESEETTMLSDVITLLTDGITGLGGVLLVFGLVNLGMTVKDGMQGGGGQLSGAIAMIVADSSSWSPPATSAPSTGAPSPATRPEVSACFQLQSIKTLPNISRNLSAR